MSRAAFDDIIEGCMAGVMTAAEGAVKSISAVDAPTFCSGDTDGEHIVEF